MSSQSWLTSLRQHTAISSFSKNVKNIYCCISNNLCQYLIIKKSNICCKCCPICCCVSTILGLKFMEILCCAYFKQNLVFYSIYGAKLGQIYKLVHKYNEIIFYTTASVSRLPPSILFEVTGSQPSRGRLEHSK